uniref:Uncharacterized protein n=1 Tax=Anguilla anguilla TaxID=7936 RepID=A0A0E9P694_ANGAN
MDEHEHREFMHHNLLHHGRDHSKLISANEKDTTKRFVICISTDVFFLSSKGFHFKRK